MLCAWIHSCLFLWFCVSVGKGLTKQDGNIIRSYNYPYYPIRQFQKTVSIPWIKRPNQYKTLTIDPQSYFRNYGSYDSRTQHQPSPETRRYPYYGRIKDVDKFGSRPNCMVDDPTNLLNKLENVILLYRRKAMEIIPNIGILNITSRQRLLRDYLTIADRLYILFVRLSTQLKMYLTEMVDRRTWMLKQLMDLSSLTIHEMQPRQPGVPINKIREYFMQLRKTERTLNLNCLIYFLENMSPKEPMDNPKPPSTAPTPMATRSWMLPFSNLRNITYGSVFYFPEKSKTLNRPGQN
ncbi:hypothetical protein SNE40_008236 [Patella caerulea]|uniref:Uncharacterized protein n=1 Tax=Patella caerulea TaxID=87958 RepID=A0AAN8K7S2_PATCE